MRVLYLIFNERYTSSSGPALRRVDPRALTVPEQRYLSMRADDLTGDRGILQAIVRRVVAGSRRGGGPLWCEYAFH
jgi:hypothetical protein